MMQECAGITDVLSLLADKNRTSILVLPTLDHAVYFWWARFILAARERHGSEACVVTRSAVVSQHTNSVVRLWVPYTLEPTLPMDFTKMHDLWRYTLVSPYRARDCRI